MKTTSYVLFTFLILGNLIQAHHHYKCIHDQLNFTKPLKSRSRVSTNSVPKPLSEIPWTQIRIHIDFTTFDKYNSISKEKLDAMRNIVIKATELLTKLLYVKRTEKIIVEKDVCSNLINPSSELLEGIDTDLVIFPLIDLSSFEGLAYAIPCEIDETTYRPNIGTITFIEKEFDMSLKGYLQRYVHIALHELNHVLGFSSNTFHLFIDENGKIIPHDKTFRTETINGILKTFLITPKVMKAGQKHFNCKNFKGLELENHGGTGTQGSHWEGRLMTGDYMTGTLNYELTISDISLALLEDSGWYKVNYYTGGLFRYGKNAGCSFLTKPCIINGKITFPNEFCNVAKQMLCSPSALSRGQCDLYDNQSNLPREYQFFPGYPKRGGYSSCDYCPSLSSTTPDYNGMSCIDGEKLSLIPANKEETYGHDSICFLSNLKPKDEQSEKTMNPFCYKTECDYDKKELKVFVLDKTFTCPYEGGKISMNEHFSGSIQCPKFNMVCTNIKKCSEMIECIEKEAVALDTSFDYFNNNPLI